MAPASNNHGAVPQCWSAQYPSHAPPPIATTNVIPRSRYGPTPFRPSIIGDFPGGGFGCSAITTPMRVRQRQRQPGTLIHTSYRHTATSANVSTTVGKWLAMIALDDMIVHKYCGHVTTPGPVRGGTRWKSERFFPRQNSVPTLEPYARLSRLWKRWATPTSLSPTMSWGLTRGSIITLLWRAIPIKVWSMNR